MPSYSMTRFDATKFYKYNMIHFQLDPDFNHTELYLNGAFFTNITAPQNYFNFTGLTSDTLYYYVVNSTDGSQNSAQSTERTFRTQTLADTTPRVIESITLYPANTTAGAKINVTVKASDNIGVIEVTADGVSLTYSNGEWDNGSITAPSTIGSYTVTIWANDSAGRI
jgi:hypothetical protein